MTVLQQGRQRRVGHVPLVHGVPAPVRVRVPHHPLGPDRRPPQRELVGRELAGPDMRPLHPRMLGGLFDRRVERRVETAGHRSRGEHDDPPNTRAHGAFDQVLRGRRLGEEEHPVHAVERHGLGLGEIAPDDLGSGKIGLRRVPGQGAYRDPRLDQTRRHPSPHVPGRPGHQNSHWPLLFRTSYG